MKTVIIADIHGRITWKDILEAEKPDKVIFLGDYWDSFDISFEKQLDNFKNIISYREQFENTVLLLGNHDYHYHRGPERYSGFQSKYSFLINDQMEKYKDYFKIAHKEGDYLFTHAGVSDTFLKENNFVGEIDEFLNDLWKYKPLSFRFNGYDQYGDNISQSPLWIRPKSLLKDSKLTEHLIQVVGHTTVERLGVDPEKRFYFTDTLGTSKEFLVLDGDLKIKKL